MPNPTARRTSLSAASRVGSTISVTKVAMARSVGDRDGHGDQELRLEALVQRDGQQTGDSGERG